MFSQPALPRRFYLNALGRVDSPAILLHVLVRFAVGVRLADQWLDHEPVAIVLGKLQRVHVGETCLKRTADKVRISGGVLCDVVFEGPYPDGRWQCVQASCGLFLARSVA